MVLVQQQELCLLSALCSKDANTTFIVLFINTDTTLSAIIMSADNIAC